jgi:hypothetical protein
MSKRPLCGRDGCTYERVKGKQRCLWHWLLPQPADIQQRAATRRRTVALSEEGVSPTRVKPKPWPSGERWCSGCQSFVPLFYTTGSRCKACASNAAHGHRIRREYGITPEDYDALFRFQKGRCYICRRKPRTKRLAVDHDHRTGQVRGLLCANNENGCNRAIVANLEAAADGGLAAARRAVKYLEHSPYAQMKGLPPSPDRFNFSHDTTPKEPPF